MLAQVQRVRELGVAGLAALVAVVDVEARVGYRVIVYVGFITSFRGGIFVGFFGWGWMEEREVETQPEIDRVVVGRLPLEDVRVGAELVGTGAAGEDEAVVVVLEAREDLLEHELDGVRELHLLHLDLEGLKPELLGVLLEEVLVGLQQMIAEVGQPLVERLAHQLGLAVEREQVEDEELGLHLGPAPDPVHDQLAVDQRAAVAEGHLLLVDGQREVQRLVVDVPVVVLAVDQVVPLW